MQLLNSIIDKHAKNIWDKVEEKIELHIFEHTKSHDDCLRSCKTNNEEVNLIN